jgi:hypothetical protein
MVWAGICSTGKTRLVFVERNVKINAANYQTDILAKHLKPWATRHFGNRRWYYQQDWAPAHGAKTTMEFCRTQLGRGTPWKKDMWPSASPDLNPLDYSVWGILEQRLGTKRFKSVPQLKRALRQAWRTFTPEELARIVGQFPRRLDACVEARGGNFEHLL